MRRSRMPLAVEERREFDYHLDGVLEAAAATRRHSRNLRLNVDTDVKKTAAALSKLEVEIFFHLAYHMKHLRRPFTRLHNLAHALLDEVDPPEPKARQNKKYSATKNIRKSTPANKKRVRT